MSGSFIEGFCVPTALRMHGSFGKGLFLRFGSDGKGFRQASGGVVRRRGTCEQ